ncbi:MAG: iron ABC transporter permease [Gammaproteobacteria bacterium]|nr:iron ABC transporter permease [Gammaproteobacteria bacterium]
MGPSKHFGILWAGLVIALLMALILGPLDIPCVEIIRALFGASQNPLIFHILYQLRLPGVLAIAASGFALGVSGAAMQGLLRNPLADPALLGVASGASVAVIVLMWFFLALGISAVAFSIFLPMAAFGGGLMAVGLIALMARLLGTPDMMSVLLAGIALSALLAAVASVLLLMLDNQGLHLALWWGFGGLTNLAWPVLVWNGLVIAIATTLLWLEAKALNVLSLGELGAMATGVNVQKLRRWVLIGVAFSVGASVALTGPIAFIGLIVPHMMRLWLGTDHRSLLPASGLCGAIVLLMASMIAKILIAPMELPMGIITAFIGVPFFLWLLIHQRGRDVTS